MATQADLDTVLDEAFAKLDAALVQFGDRLLAITAASDKLTESLTKLSASAEKLADHLAKTVSATPGKSPAPGGPPAPGGAGKPKGGAPGGGAASLGKIAAVAGAVAGTISAVLNKLEGFVAALNPAVIQRFHWVIDNFNATVGSAFVSVFVSLTEAIRIGAGLIKPAMEALAPIVRILSEVIGNFLVRYIQIAADQLKSIIPVIEVLAKAVEPLLESLLVLVSFTALFGRMMAIALEVLLKFLPITVLLQALTVVLKALNGIFEVLAEAMTIFQVVIDVIAAAITSFFESLIPLNDIMKQLRDVVQWVIKNMYLLAIAIAKFFGLSDVVNAIIKSLEDRTKEGDVKAQQTRIVGFEQLAKDIATKSAGAGAGGAGGVDDPKVFYRELLAEAKKAASSGASFQDMVQKGFNEVIEKLKSLIPAPLRAAEAAAEKSIAVVDRVSSIESTPGKWRKPWTW